MRSLCLWWVTSIVPSDIPHNRIHEDKFKQFLTFQCQNSGDHCTCRCTLLFWELLVVLRADLLFSERTLFVAAALVCVAGAFLPVVRHDNLPEVLLHYISNTNKFSRRNIFTKFQEDLTLRRTPSQLPLPLIQCCSCDWGLKTRRRREGDETRSLQIRWQQEWWIR